MDFGDLKVRECLPIVDRIVLGCLWVCDRCAAVPEGLFDGGLDDDRFPDRSRFGKSGSLIPLLEFAANFQQGAFVQSSVGQSDQAHREQAECRCVVGRFGVIEASPSKECPAQEQPGRPGGPPEPMGHVDRDKDDQEQDQHGVEGQTGQESQPEFAQEACEGFLGIELAEGASMRHTSVAWVEGLGRPARFAGRASRRLERRVSDRIGIVRGIDRPTAIDTQAGSGDERLRR